MVCPPFERGNVAVCREGRKKGEVYHKASLFQVSEGRSVTTSGNPSFPGLRGQSDSVEKDGRRRKKVCQRMIAADIWADQVLGIFSS